MKILSHFGLELSLREGSHVKLRMILSDGMKQTFIIPLHEELDRGTLKAIYRQASRYVLGRRIKGLSL